MKGREGDWCPPHDLFDGARSSTGLDIDAMFLSAMYVSAQLTGFYRDTDAILSGWFVWCPNTPLSSTFVYEAKTCIGRRRTLFHDLHLSPTVSEWSEITSHTLLKRDHAERRPVFALARRS